MTMKIPLTHRSRVLMIAAILMGATTGTAFADTSLRLGTTFPGWDKLGSTGVEGRIEESVADLAGDYARQLGRFCSLPEVFLRENSSSVLTAMVFYETYLPYGSREEVLLDTYDQRVSVVHREYGGDALVVLIELDGLGVAMAVCGI